MNAYLDMKSIAGGVFHRVCAVMLALLLASSAAIAGSPEYTTSPGTGNFSFATKYPTYYATYGCTSCHTSPPALNSYGTSYKTALVSVNGTLRPPPQAGVGPALTTAESQDSDGDGYKNITEITANTAAYDASAHPTASVVASTTQNAKSGTAPTTVSYTVTITNNGTITDSFTLGVSVFSGQTWTPSITGTANNVAAGGAASITVNVAIPGTASGGQTSVARVTAVSQANTSVSATPLDLTTTTPVVVVGPRFVNAGTGSDAGDCRTIATPCKTITYAMGQAATGSPGDAINVAPGTYNVALGEVFPISIKSGVQLQSSGNAGNTTVDATGSNARVFNASGSNSSTLLRGFRIQGGFHQPPADGSNAQGGALAIDNVSTIKVSRNLFTGNESRGSTGVAPTHPTGGEAYGGAIYSANSSPTIENNVFVSNTVQGGAGVNKFDGTAGGNAGNGHGGAVWVGGGSTTVIANNTFYGNIARGGAGGSSNALRGGNGGLAFNGAVEANNSTINNNIIANNSAVGGAAGAGSPAGTAGTAFAGGLNYLPNPGPTTPTDNLFFGNSSNGDLGNGSLLADPLFHSAPTNLRVRLGSPASGAGTPLSAPNNDFDGTVRPNPPSIGAFEASAVASTTALVSSLNPSALGQSVTFTATVTGVSGTPAGSATFKDGTTAICSSVTLTAGQAVCTTSALSSGTRSITAEYSGDAIYAASVSSAVSQVVNAPATSTLTITKAGAGTGTVTSSPAGITCGATCAAPFTNGSAVTLTAAASAGSTFAGWSGGGCTGNGTCTITISAATGVTATFDVTPPGSFALTINKAGSGSGTVTSSPAGIACGATCSASFTAGASVTLTAAAAAGSTFTGWSAGCTGTGTCLVTMNAASSVTATFTAPAPDLVVTQSSNLNPASSGKDVIFSVTVTNSGTVGATNVVLTNPIPGGASYVWSSLYCSVSGSVTCNVGSLAVGATYSYQVVLRPTAAGSITNTASATLTQTDANPSNNSSSLNVPVSASPAAVAVLRYRLYSPVSLEHHFTTDLNEYTVLGASGAWVQEGTVGKVLNNPGSFNGVTTTPYYRLYNTFSRWHHWTTDPNEYYTLGTFPGWGQEGVDGYILPTLTTGAMQLYRLVYPNGTGLHHWTVDSNEYTTLIGVYGWVGEGGAGFVIQ